MNWLLIGLIVLLLVNVFFGFKNGLWNAVTTFVTLLLLLFMMNLVLPSFIGSMNIQDEMLLETTLNEEKDLNYLMGLLPDQIEGKLLCGYASYDEVMAADPELANMIAGKLASFGVIIAMLIALVFALFVLRPIGALHDKLIKIPVIKKLDKIIGMGIAFVDGMIMIYMVFIGIIIYSTTKYGVILHDMIYQSEILTMLYENNLILKILF